MSEGVKVFGSVFHAAPLFVRVLSLHLFNKLIASAEWNVGGLEMDGEVG